MNIEWKKEYSVNVKIIDEQHKEFFKIFSLLSDAIDSQSTKKELGRIIDALLIGYTGYHFATEEFYMDKFNYALKDEHKKEHQSFTKKIEEFKKKYKDKELEISFELVDFLGDWLVNHIANHDRKYIKCFNEHGLF